MKIGPLKKVTSEAIVDINHLMAQLRDDAGKTAGTKAELRAIIENKHAAMVVVEDKHRVVGVATLYILQKIGKRTAYVEDVVVDEAYRGKGLGKKLMKAIVAVAKSKKVQTVHLTSRPERKAANALYQKLGFTARKTNPYSISL